MSAALETTACPDPAGTQPPPTLRKALERDGWLLLPRLGGQAAAEAVLAGLGRLMPQDRGEFRYDVQSTTEAAGLSSSKSANALNPHTEASYYPSPPRWVALWCRHAARCGGGQTLLAEGQRILDGLDEADRDFATCHRLAFGDASRPAAVDATVFSPGPPPVFRFSYNLLRHGCYDPPQARITGAPAPASARETFAEHVANSFAALARPVLLPDDGLLVFDNHRMLHSRTAYSDTARHLIRYWLA